MPVILVSMQTGLFCRLAVYLRPSNGRRLSQAGPTTVVYGMLGDQPTAATATPFIYSRKGLVYDGEPMVAEGLFYPLLWSNTSGVVTGNGSASITPLPTGEPVCAAVTDAATLLRPMAPADHGDAGDAPQCPSLRHQSNTHRRRSPTRHRCWSKVCDAGCGQ